MAQCEVCGNDYDKPMEISVAGARHVFDSFECAIHALAPRCEHCGCTVIGHGVEADGRFFCCAHCAGHEGIDRIVDRADAPTAA
jgi:Rieske Fe-S protein